MLKKIIKKFKTNKKNVSIYEKILLLDKKNEIKEYEFKEYSHSIKYECEFPGKFELEYSSKDNRKIDSKEFKFGFEEFLIKDSLGLDRIRNFFNREIALDFFEEFEYMLFSRIDFDELKLVSLSILLMRDSFEFESVKFGIYLTKYFPVENYPKIINIIQVLGKRPEFTRYALEAFNNLTEKNKYLEELKNKSFGYGYEFLERNLKI